MTEIIVPRRRFLTGLVGLVAAPAVVKAESLMKIVAVPTPDVIYYNPQDAFDEAAKRLIETYSVEMRKIVADALYYGHGFMHVMSAGEIEMRRIEKAELLA